MFISDINAALWLHLFNPFYECLLKCLEFAHRNNAWSQLTFRGYLALNKTCFANGIHSVSWKRPWSFAGWSEPLDGFTLVETEGWAVAAGDNVCWACSPSPSDTHTGSRCDPHPSNCQVHSHYAGCMPLTTIQVAICHLSFPLNRGFSSSTK